MDLIGGMDLIPIARMKNLSQTTTELLSAIGLRIAFPSSCLVQTGVRSGADTAPKHGNDG